MKIDLIVELYKVPRTVFSLREIALILGENRFDALKAKINYYVKNGVLKGLRRGVYAKPKYDPLELAMKVYRPAYISFETVLQKTGVIFQYSETLTVASYLSRVVTIDNTILSYRKLKSEVLLNSKGIEMKETYAIANKERAFLDLLYLDKDRFFDNVAILDKTQIEKILPIYASASLEKRVRKVLS